MTYLSADFSGRLMLRALLCVVLVTLYCSVAVAQATIPETIELKPGFVGLRYELPLQRLLPEHAPIISWKIVCNGTGAGNVDLSCPQGLYLEETRDAQGNFIGNQLLVQPTAKDLLKDPNKADSGLRTKPYIFELAGVKVDVLIRFQLRVKPLG